MNKAKITYHSDGGFTVDESGYVDVEQLLDAVEENKKAVKVTMPYALAQEILTNHPAVSGIDRPGKYELEDWIQTSHTGRRETRIARFERVRETD